MTPDAAKVPLESTTQPIPLTLHGENGNFLPIDLGEPSRYYETLLSLIKDSKNKIVLSALYLGIGNLEHKILRAIGSALSDEHNRPHLTVTIILDHSRAQRGYPNSISMLNELVALHHPRMRVLLYQMPQLRSNTYSFSSIFLHRLPIPLKEVLGVYHCKFCVFDDSAILTGANLSNEYFVSRQDRYLYFPSYGSVSSASGTGCRSNLVSFLDSFTSIVARHCHELQPTKGNCTSAKIYEEDGVTVRNYSESPDGQGWLLLEPLASDACTLKEELDRLSNTSNDNKAIGKDGLASPHTIALPLIQHSVVGITQESQYLSKLSSSSILSSFVSQSIATKGLVSATTWKPSSLTVGVATPYSSFRPVFAQQLVCLANTGIGAATGRLGLRGTDEDSQHQHQLQESEESEESQESGVRVCVTVPDTSAHGFGSASGLKSHIPSMHRLLLDDAIEQGIESMQLEQRRQEQQQRQHVYCSIDTDRTSYSVIAPFINLYRRADWTYHSKGIWLVPTIAAAPTPYRGSGEGSSSGDGGGIYAASYIGSSNFGERSWSRDFELGFFLSTHDPQFARLLQTEYAYLQSFCEGDYSGVIDERLAAGAGAGAGAGTGKSIDNRGNCVDGSAIGESANISSFGAYAAASGIPVTRAHLSAAQVPTKPPQPFPPAGTAASAASAVYVPAARLIATGPCTAPGSVAHWLLTAISRMLREFL